MSTEKRDQLIRLHSSKYREYKNADEKSYTKKEKFEKRHENAPKTLMENAEEEKKGIERRLEDNDKHLKDLIAFGNELVTNVKVANEKRELLRRNYEAVRRDDLITDLEKESQQALSRFEEITAKWTELKHLKEPMGLFEELEAQKVRIGDLMKQKDELIAQCQEELKRVDEKYYLDQEKQGIDTTCLVERIDNQIELIKTAYDEHLELLESTIEEERVNIGNAATAKWQDLYERMVGNVNGKYELEREKEKFYSEEIARITREQEEITRATRIRLDRDAEILQLELRNTKNNVLMNSEKLDYNYQILKKRNEENVIINNQQKRRVAKLNFAISALKRKIRETKTNAEVSIKKLSKEVVSLHTNITELETKSEQIKMHNAKKYQNVWDVNYQEAFSLVNRIMDIDRILHEQQLGIDWQRPVIPGLKKREALAAKNKKKTKTKFAVVKTDGEAETRLLRNVLRKISERAIFLIEERLLKILEPYSEVEKCLVRIDNIFGALKISNIEDVKSLTEYFLPYAWCPNCSNGLHPQVLAKLYALDTNSDYIPSVESKQDESYVKSSAFDMESQESTSSQASITESALDLDPLKVDEAEDNVDRMLAGKATFDLHTDESDDDRHIEIAEKVSDKTVKCSNHYFVIEPALVLVALKEFTEKHLSRNRMNVDLYNSRSSAPLSLSGTINTESSLPKSTNRNAADIKKFWSDLLQVLPQNKHNLWKSLEHGLNHFYVELKEREDLDARCEFLRNQNAELKHLLQKYLKDEDI